MSQAAVDKIAPPEKVFVNKKTGKPLPDFLVKKYGLNKGTNNDTVNLQTQKYPNYSKSKAEKVNMYIPPKETNDTLLPDPMIKGHTNVGGLDSLDGLGQVGPKDSSFNNKNEKPIIKPFDTIDLQNKNLHYKDLQKPGKNIQIKEPKGFTLERDNFKVGLCKGLTKGYKSNIDKQRFSGVVIGTFASDSLPGNKVNVDFSVDKSFNQPLNDINTVANTARYGYQTDVVPHDKYGVVEPLYQPARVINSYGAGNKIITPALPSTGPFGYRSGGYYFSGRESNKVIYNPE